MNDSVIGGDSAEGDGTPDTTEDAAGSTRRGGLSRRSFVLGSGAGIAVTSTGMLTDLAGAITSSAVVAENSLAGAPKSQWWSTESPNIVGFVDGLSLLPGDTARFKVSTPSSNYRIRIYRLGWYGGNGARWLADVTPSVSLPQTQPSPVVQSATRLVDCGNWAVSASWTVPSTALSGVYYAKLERRDVSGQSNFALFVVRSNDPADILVQTSDATWHAYNMYGGASLYFGDAGAPFNSQRATKVSYNRPLSRSTEQESTFFGPEYPLVRWLERNGYSINYCTQLDTHRDAQMLRRHKVFISSGHDEYWTKEQRANVTAARDAGVNLIFFSGNEVFWKTRMESSVAGTTTTNRTLVCYKETLDGAKTDPSSEWTGTWRDARFSPPSNGGLPENALTGQLFRCINPTYQPDFNLEVPSDYSKLRFWRNTPVATLAAGQKRVLADSTLGYEWDEVVENGVQPGGLIRLSRTTATANEVLIDEGATYVPGTVTHHMTMYRAPGGGLVFGAGTVQWAYGLDSEHISDSGTATDTVIQQATINLLADMGAQPGSRQSGTVAASKSTDTLAPTTTILTPAPGASVSSGSPLSVTGTAVDAGGGVVAGVEWSIDGGATWRAATGTTSWSAVITPTTQGSLTILVRAIDDSCNIQAAPASVAVTVTGRALPAPLFPAGTTPSEPRSNDGTSIEVGARIQPMADGVLTAVRYFKASGTTGTHVGKVWSSTGTLLASATFTAETSVGWQSVPIAPVAVTAGTTYVVSVYSPSGDYVGTQGFFSSAYELWPLRAPANGSGGSNGLFRYGAGFPNQSWGASNYWVDAVFDTVAVQGPRVTDRSPAADTSQVATDTTVKVTFDRAVQQSSIVFELLGQGGVAVPGTGAWDSATLTYTFTPSNPLAPLTNHTAKLTAATATGGQGLASPETWTFTTRSADGSGPAGLWDSSAVPAATSLETAAVELGTTFRATAAGSVVGLRFYKASGSPGPHVGHLWDTTTGQLLATATFDNTSASGWQQVTLPSPVSLVVGRSYVVSYYAPGGVYGYSSEYFSGNARVSGPLTAPATATGSPNGVFRYGVSGYPTDTWRGACYWVDVLFSPSTTGGVLPPTLVTRDPGPGVSSVPTSATVTAGFDAAVDTATVQFTLAGPGGTAVPAAISFADQNRTAVLTPQSPLSQGTTYTATVRVAAPGGALGEPAQWTFTTVAPVSSPSGSLWSGASVPAVAAADDTAAVELGVKFTVSQQVAATAIRFYKGAGNGGTHLGRLWTAAGQLLGTATFPNETSSGWQQGALAAPVVLSPGTTYIASYHAPQGRYSIDSGYFSGRTVDSPPLQAPASTGGSPNGVFAYGAGGFPSGSWNASNYWVDVVVQAVAGPRVVSTTPGAGAGGVAASIAPSATFESAIASQSLQFQLRDGGGGLVAGSAAWNGSTNTATFTPSAALSTGATYTASVSAADAQGNAMSSPTVWSFTVAGGDVGVFVPGATPQITVSTDPGAVELGMKFRSDVAGQVRGVRFHKGSANSGTHVGKLWSASGQLLAQVTFSAETASGWQSALFSSPVSIQAGTTYVVSYHAPNGNYSIELGGFNSERTNAGLRGLASGASGGNGVYLYGAGGFPTNAWNASNYWVDVLFTAT